MSSTPIRITGLDDTIGLFEKLVSDVSLIADSLAGNATPPPVEVFQRFVKIGGSDNSDGMSWETAKASLEAATLSLPEVASGGQRRRAGDIRIGPGDFHTSETIECSSDIRFWGAGAPTGTGDPSFTTGTVIHLEHNGHCFAKRDTFTDWGHCILFSDMGIEGQSVTGPYDLIRILKGGFLTELHRVRLDAAPRHGVHLEDAAVNFYAYNITGAGCKESLLSIDPAPTNNLTTVGIWGLQADNCGQYPIRINSEASGVNTFTFSSMEFEATTADQHESIIVHNPIGGDNGAQYCIDSVRSWRQTGKAAGGAVMKELTGAGSGSWWNWRNVSGDHEHTFHSEKSGVAHSDFTARFSGSVGRSQTHDIRVGPIAIGTTLNAPSDGDGRPDGSVMYRMNGTTYRKVAGSWILSESV